MVGIERGGRLILRLVDQPHYAQAQLWQQRGAGGPRDDSVETGLRIRQMSAPQSRSDGAVGEGRRADDRDGEIRRPAVGLRRRELGIGRLRTIGIAGFRVSSGCGAG